MPFLQLILPIGSADPAPFEDALLAAGALFEEMTGLDRHVPIDPKPGIVPPA
ncbi:MAG: hypothetical protein HC869_12325 [Rhodospirillales bacterium]|nr:hypothetical protein [Rhodospirillales bacterium]